MFKQFTSVLASQSVGHGDARWVEHHRVVITFRGHALAVGRTYSTNALLSRKLTGNGLKRALRGGGPRATPDPRPARLPVAKGDVGWRRLLGTFDQVLLPHGGMGSHSADCPQGNSPAQTLGCHVESRTVKGRLHGVGVSQDKVRITEHESPYILIPELQVAHGG